MTSVAHGLVTDTGGVASPVSVATIVPGIDPATREEPRRGARRPRLHHVDAMRPIKQLGVVTTHAFAFFAPATGIAVGASVLVTHVTRFAFIFISAAMLVYAYPTLTRATLKIFWRRRLLAVGLPYVTWTVIYFATKASDYHSAGAAVGQFVYYLTTGYFQLYFLLLLLELCVVYPLVLWIVTKTERHHRLLFLASLVLQLVLMGLAHWGLLAGALGKGNGMLELWNYQLYVVSGALLAWHYERAHAWLIRHVRLVVGATLAAVGFAEAWFILSDTGVVPGIGGTNAAAVFQPATVPMYLGLVVAIYLVGVVLVEWGRRRPLIGSLVRLGVDDSYGIYLSQVLIFQGLVFLRWRSLESSLGWPLATVLSIVVVYFVSTALTSLLARFPGARGLAGRPRVDWRTVPSLREKTALAPVHADST